MPIAVSIPMSIPVSIPVSMGIPDRRSGRSVAPANPIQFLAKLFYFMIFFPVLNQKFDIVLFKGVKAIFQALPHGGRCD